MNVIGRVLAKTDMTGNFDQIEILDHEQTFTIMKLFGEMRSVVKSIKVMMIFVGAVHCFIVSR